MLGTILRTERQTTVEPLVAWRVWALHLDRDAQPRLRPIVGSRKPWPMLVPASAECRRHLASDIPAFDCRCGLHAVHASESLRRTRSPAVVGTVALWGRIVEHTHGYRAAFGYPQRLRLVCYLCFWRRGLHSGRPDVVTQLHGGRLIPLCLEHVELSNRYGFATPRLAPATEVGSTLLSAYAVDPLPG